MKVVVLSLCILTGVVDAKNDGVIVLEVASPSGSEIEHVLMTSEVLPPDIREGEKVSITAFANKELEKYCQSPL